MKTKKKTTEERLVDIESAVRLMLKHIKNAGEMQAAFAAKMYADQKREEASQAWCMEAQRNAINPLRTRTVDRRRA